jgi:hypothetical protein
VATQALAEISPPTNLPAPRRGLLGHQTLRRNRLQIAQELAEVEINGLLGVTAGPSPFPDGFQLLVRQARTSALWRIPVHRRVPGLPNDTAGKSPLIGPGQIQEDDRQLKAVTRVA